jgi:hypothetical protein
MAQAKPSGLAAPAFEVSDFRKEPGRPLLDGRREGVPYFQCRHGQ